MRTAQVSVLFFCVFASAVFASQSAHARPAAKTVESGKTQVVAKAAGREITLTELHVEMARLNLSPNDPASERIAVENIINRTLLSRAARASSLHRRPEALVQMKAAQEQALADLYLGITSQPPEPTRQEVEDFISDNPALFAKRRSYVFSVLSLPTEAFDEEKLTPLFDETRDFAKLENTLRVKNVDFTVSNTAQPSTAFPDAIRKQLAQYTVKDNIVLKGESQTQIMKIMKAQPSPSQSSEWPALARRLILDQETLLRAEKLVKRLREETTVSYYRDTAKPVAVASEAAAPAIIKP